MLSVFISVSLIPMIVRSCIASRAPGAIEVFVYRLAQGPAARFARRRKRLRAAPSPAAKGYRTWG